jgi:hypothetical protein
MVADVWYFGFWELDLDLGLNDVHKKILIDLTTSMGSQLRSGRG